LFFSLPVVLLVYSRCREFAPRFWALTARALAIDEKAYGPEHPDVAIGLNNLAQLLQATSRLGEAEPLMRRALAINEKSLGTDDPNTVTFRNNLAKLLRQEGKNEEADKLLATRSHP